MRMPPLVTRRFALSRAEAVTTAVAGLVSSTAYVVSGHPYLARGVVGDLLGFAVLATAGSLARSRVRHEALLCLALIGSVTAAAPAWPLRIGDGAWWALFLAALTGYVALRRRLCD